MKKQLKHKGCDLILMLAIHVKKEFFINHKELAAPPALGNWGARQEL
jgi:hypothetical protein